jgi:cyclopropane fatty-acyl-phospholipid synthase-like methyltransferase
MNQQATADLYDSVAPQWTRDAQVLLSDFTARPFVIEQLAPFAGAHVLDLGCGEGYLSRQMRSQGAASLLGVDISPHMIELARASEKSRPLGIEYRVGDASRVLDNLPLGSFDRIAAVFLFNYMTRAQMTESLRSARKLLSKGGCMVFTVPHPSFPFLCTNSAPFFFLREESGYFSGVDRELNGRIWRRDGMSLPVRCFHKTFEDYFCALREAGWTAMPRLMELHVHEEHLALDPAFFAPLEELPLHVLFKLER